MQDLTPLKSFSPELAEYFYKDKIRVYTEELKPLIEAAQQGKEEAFDKLSEKVYNQFIIKLNSTPDNYEKMQLLFGDGGFIPFCNEVSSPLTLLDIYLDIAPLLKNCSDSTLFSSYYDILYWTQKYNNVGTLLFRRLMLGSIWREIEKRGLLSSDKKWSIERDNLYNQWESAAVDFMKAPITEIGAIAQLRAKIIDYKEILSNSFYLIEPENQRTIKQAYAHAVQELEQRLEGSAYEKQYDDYLLIADYWNEENKSIPCVKNSIAWLRRQVLSGSLEQTKDNNDYNALREKIEKVVKYLTTAKRGEIGEHIGHLHQFRKTTLKSKVSPYIEELKNLEPEIPNTSTYKPLREAFRTIISLYDQRLSE